MKGLLSSRKDRCTLVVKFEEWDFHAIQWEVLTGLFRKSVGNPREKLSEERSKNELNER